MVCKYCYSENANVFFGIPAQSNDVSEYEKFIHRRFYPLIIHPYSRFRVYWEFYFVFHIIVRLTVICYLWAVMYHRNISYQVTIICFQVINIVDIILMFFTGYVESSTRMVVLEPKKIALRYLTRTFVFDLIAAFPIDIIFFNIEQSTLVSIFSDSCWTYTPSSYLCSLARFPIFTLYLYNLARVFLWDRLIIEMLIICVLMYLVILFSANFYLCNLRNNSLPAKKGLQYLFPVTKSEKLGSYFETLLLIVLDCLFFEIKFPIKSDLIKCIVLNLTFIGSALFTACFINYVIVRIRNREKFLDVETQVRSLVRTKNFNSSLKNKTFLYFHILLGNRYTKDDEIFNYIPDTFKGDIFYHLCLPLLKNFYCFEDLPTFVMRRLAESLNYQLYLPNELVMSEAEPVLRIYFVQRGTVALYSSKDVELYHFEAGSNFNGRNFVLGELTNTNYAISIEVTEVYRLNHDDFMEIMSAFPQLYQKMTDKVRENRRESAYLID